MARIYKNDYDGQVLQKLVCGRCYLGTKLKFQYGLFNYSSRAKTGALQNKGSLFDFAFCPEFNVLVFFIKCETEKSKS